MELKPNDAYSFASSSVNQYSRNWAISLTTREGTYLIKEEVGFIFA